MNSSSRPPVILGATLLGGIVVFPLFATGQSWELIPLTAIGALTVLFWRPIQAWARSFGQEDVSHHDVSELRQRLESLEERLKVSASEQHRLAETLLWQERLLRHTIDDTVGTPPRWRQTTPHQHRNNERSSGASDDRRDVPPAGQHAV